MKRTRTDEWMATGCYRYCGATSANHARKRQSINDWGGHGFKKRSWRSRFTVGTTKSRRPSSRTTQSAIGLIRLASSPGRAIYYSSQTRYRKRNSSRFSCFGHGCYRSRRIIMAPRDTSCPPLAGAGTRKPLGPCCGLVHLPNGGTHSDCLCGTSFLLEQREREARRPRSHLREREFAMI